VQGNAIRIRTTGNARHIHVTIAATQLYCIYGPARQRSLDHTSGHPAKKAAPKATRQQSGHQYTTGREGVEAGPGALCTSSKRKRLSGDGGVIPGGAR
jgi:hypothetical protein